MTRTRAALVALATALREDGLAATMTLGTRGVSESNPGLLPAEQFRRLCAELMVAPRAHTFGAVAGHISPFAWGTVGPVAVQFSGESRPMTDEERRDAIARLEAVQP